MSPLFRISSGNGYYGEDYYGRSKTPAYYSRNYWDSLSESAKPYVKIEELDSATDTVISRKNYSYTPSSLALYATTGLSTYVSPSSLVHPTTLSDWYPYYRLSTSLWNADPLTHSRALLSIPPKFYPWRSSFSYYPYSTHYTNPTFRYRYQVPYHDSSYYINRLLPYYYHPRPVYHSTYSPIYHYHYETPRASSVTRTSRTYYVPPAITYNYTPATYAYAYSSNRYLL